ncbi:TRAP transporter substrate-binding protein [Maribrevibacterium harenarium]|uniref:TRAP transporter substrate-binding protein n=1 Tax=Maribrevibacterium harenarium TaxID=2589817 RepID=A0A501WMR7_9GAMM|nr:TRAP transporter substrate-binding protein [Maribrevibacterium harenarium]TPE48577.1 TRAP transporter substrate-binding protein [Maribrevibacterium harenarium]
MKHTNLVRTTAKWSVSIAVGAVSVYASATTFTMSNWVPPTHFVTTNILNVWADNVELATNGRIKIRMLPKPVGSPPQHWELARKGIADVTWGNFTYEPERFKSIWFAEFPLNGEDVQASSVALWQTYNEYLIHNDAYKGVKLLGVGTLGPGVINHGSVSVTSLDQLKNQKIRMGGPIQKVILEEMGAIPVAAPATKTYELIDGGVIDGSMNPIESVVSFRLTDVLNHHTKIPQGLYDGAFFLAMNEKKWNKLSEQDKAAIESVSGETFARLWGGVFQAQNDFAQSHLKDLGHDFPQPDQALVDRVQTIQQNLLTSWVNDGPSFQMEDPMNVFNFYRASYNAHAKR